MKKITSYIIVVFFLVATTFMITKILIKQQDLTKGAKTKKSLPNFTFYNLDSIATTNSFITKGSSFCVFYFNSDCEYCQNEAKELKHNIRLFKNVQVIMVSFNSIADIKKFKKEYNLNYPNITFLQDPKFEFKEWFGKSSVPAVFIYNSQHKLVKEYHGETKMETILKSLTL